MSTGNSVSCVTNLHTSEEIKNKSDGAPGQYGYVKVCKLRTKSSRRYS